VYALDGASISLVWFPQYVPDENPQEKVWKARWSVITHNRHIENIDTAIDELVEYFNTTSFPYSFMGRCPVS